MEPARMLDEVQGDIAPGLRVGQKGPWHRVFMLGQITDKKLAKTTLADVVSAVFA